MKRGIHINSLPWRQKGVALAVGMVLLVVITLLSLTAMRSANLDTKIAVNHQHKQVAFQTAENALTKLTLLSREEIRDLRMPRAEGDCRYIQDGTACPTDETQLCNTISDWYSTSEYLPSAATAALKLTEISPKGKYKFSGYGLNIITYIFQADSCARVENTNARSHNRMEVALIRE